MANPSAWKHAPLCESYSTKDETDCTCRRLELEAFARQAAAVLLLVLLKNRNLDLERQAARRALSVLSDLSETLGTLRISHAS